MVEVHDVMPLVNQSLRGRFLVDDDAARRHLSVIHILGVAEDTEIVEEVGFGPFSFAEMLVEAKNTARTVGYHLQVFLQARNTTWIESASCVGIDKVIALLHAVHYTADNVRLPLPVAETTLRPAVLIFLEVPRLKHLLVAHIDVVEEVHIFCFAFYALL